MIFIGEIGINHNGDLNLAKAMIDMAKACNIDVVKFQKRNPDICVPEDQKNKKRTFQGKDMTYLEYKKKLEFSKEEYDEINQYCKERKVSWTASVWDVDSIHFMLQYRQDIFPFIKIPSACITDYDIIKELNKTDINVIISDGMSTFDEIDNAICSIKNLKGLMHCNSSYPCNPKEIDLNVIDFYRKHYPFIPLIGYSGHEYDYFPTLMAYIKGANIIERHITLNKNMEGTDQACSLDQNDLKHLFNDFSVVDAVNGKSIPQLYPSEEKIRNKLRK